MKQQFSERRITTGQKIVLDFQGDDLEAIIIDPNGVGKGQPSVGLDLRTMVQHGLLPQMTLSDWIESVNKDWIKLPSGNTLKVHRLDIDEVFVVEICAWIMLSVNSPLDDIDFPRTPAIHGFYADAYAISKGEFTKEDSKAIEKWVSSRIGEVLRKSEHLSPEFYSWSLGILLERLEGEADPELDVLRSYEKALARWKRDRQSRENPNGWVSLMLEKMEKP